MVERRGPGAGLRLAEVRRARPARPDALAARGIGIDEVAARRPAARTSTCPPARSTARTRRFTVQATGQLMRGRGLPAADRRLPQRPARAPRASSARPSTASRTTRPPPGTCNDSAAVHHPGHPAPARHQHRRGGRRRQGAAAQLPEPAAGLGHRCTSSTTAPSPSATRSTTCKFTLLLTLVPGRAGHLPLPAQPLGHDHPQPGAADVHHRHLRRHVPAGLQPRQPVADGADALGRVRRGRRHRDAREHRPPHGDGRRRRWRRRSTARGRSASRSSR